MSKETSIEFPDTEPKDFLVLETQEQRESLNHTIRREIITALHKGFDSFSTEVKKSERVLEDGTVITEEVTIQRPSRRLWLNVQEILKNIEGTKTTANFSVYKCYYHLRLLIDQDMVEQYPPPKEDEGTSHQRVRGMFFRATAKFFVESKVDLAMRSSNLAPWDWSSDYHLGREYSESYADMLGFTLDELENLVSGWESLIHPDDLHHVIEKWDAHLAGKTALYSSEHRLKTKTGPFIWVLDRGRVIEFDTEKKPMRAAGTIQDITSEKTVMEALDRSEERYRRLFNESIQSIGILLEGRIVLANQAYSDIVGRPLSSILKMSSDEMWELIHPDDRPRLEERNSHLSQSDTLPRHRFRYVRPSGEIRWVESYVRVVEHDGEQALQTLEVDITEQMKIEQALRESENSFRSIFEDSPTGILLFNAPGNIIQLNNAAKEILGIEKDEDYSDYSTLKDPNLPQLFNVEDMNEGDIINFECPYDIKRAGFMTSKTEPIHLQVRGTVVDVEEDGTVSTYLAHIEDISERVRTREILEASEERYRNLIESRAQPTVILQGDPLRIVYANPAIAKVSGYSIMELFALGEEWVTKMFHADSLEGSLNVIKDIALGKLEPYPLGYEDEFVHKDGHSYWLRSHPSVITYNEKPALEILLIDITTEKELEFSLRNGKDSYMMYFSETTTPILLMKGTEVIDGNKAVLRLLGCKLSEITKRMIWQLSPRYQISRKSSKQIAEGIIKSAMQRRHQVATWKFQKCNGKTMLTQIRMNPIHFGDETLIQVRITPYQE
ncbi:MAG: PAS domain S-box protein [Candidatus Thorarchaeota archaeon]|jgi:PAS domain S-box-containing protein